MAIVPDAEDVVVVVTKVAPGADTNDGKVSGVVRIGDVSNGEGFGKLFDDILKRNQKKSYYYKRKKRKKSKSKKEEKEERRMG